MESDFGGWFDAVLDRYADAFLLFGLTWHIYAPTGSDVFLIVGFLAILGSFMNSYTADKYDNLMETKFNHGKKIRIGRDVRILLIAVGALLNVTYWLLLAIAILMNVESVRRMIVAYRNA